MRNGNTRFAPIALTTLLKVNNPSANTLTFSDNLKTVSDPIHLDLSLLLTTSLFAPEIEENEEG